ncbi:MAG TPA: matrixin family metalloprotease [Planktothrix sp.]
MNRQTLHAYLIAALMTGLTFTPSSFADSKPAPSVCDLPSMPIAFPPHFLRMENELLGDKDNANYLNEILDHTAGRVFHFKTMPVPVYITPFQDDPRFTAACIGGFEAWEEGSDGLVRFVQVNDANEARIKVTWKRLGLADDHGMGALGAHTTTQWKADGKSLMHLGSVPLPIPFRDHYDVPPQVIEVNLDVIYSRDAETRPLLLRNIVTHELGHALGIIGHSSNRTDIMNSDTDEFSRLSQRDINTLRELYKMRPDVTL